jgi:NAD(P) transhydrogenase subunit alpha
MGRADRHTQAHQPQCPGLIYEDKRSRRRFDVHIGVPLETQPGETRVAATPETIKKLISQGHKVTVQTGAGLRAGVPDDAYTAAGATVASPDETLAAELILKVAAPNDSELATLKSGTVVIGMLNPFSNETIARMAAQGITAFALEAAPRTSRAQSLDVLSSQANIAGYKAVLLGAHHYPRFMPMLMTAAGTVKAARVLILGAGVAGLQAIATAKRLGAVVEASDVRPAVKEQIESLGAKFIDVPYETDEERECAEGTGGYARPMPASWMQRQAVAVHERARQADIVITTALIPGRKAPVLLSAETVAQMKPGSVVVDLAAAQGGNCPLTVADQVVVEHGVTIVGHTNLPALVAADASALYARNLLDFMKLLFDKEGMLSINLEDDIVAACLMCRDGQVIRKNA